MMGAVQAADADILATHAPREGGVVASRRIVLFRPRSPALPHLATDVAQRREQSARTIGLKRASSSH